MNVRFFSSQVLGLLLDMRSRTQPFEGEVVISAINPQLHRIFRITNLDKIFRFFPDKISAVNDDDNN
jgi:anti-anti-sigma factor